MKLTYFIPILFLFSCSEKETVYEYPDCIIKPERITESSGCANIFVYQFIDSTKAIIIGIDSDIIQLTKKCQTFDLGTDNDGLTVALEVAGESPDSIYFNYCNDVAYLNKGSTKKYFAEDGIFSFSVSENDPIKDSIWETLYSVTIKIENLHFITNNDDLILDEVVFWNIGVGQLPG